MRFPKSRSWKLLVGWLLWLLPLGMLAQSNVPLDSLYCRLQTKLEKGANLVAKKDHVAAIDTLKLALTAFPDSTDIGFQRLNAEYQFQIGYAAYYENDTLEAKTALHIADSLVTKIDSRSSELRARILRQRGMVAYFMDESTFEAQDLYEEAYREWLRIPAKDSLEIAVVLQCMAQAATKLGEYEKSIDLYEQSLKIREKMFGKIHPRVGLIYLNLGNSYCYSDRYAEAAKSYQTALDIYQVVAPDEKASIAKLMLNLGVTYIKLKKFDEAIFQIQASIRLKREINSPYSLELLNNLANLADAFAEQGEIESALHALEEYSKICMHNRIVRGPSIAKLKLTEAGVLESGKVDKHKILGTLQNAMSAISSNEDLSDWRKYPNLGATTDPMLLQQIILKKSELLRIYGEQEANPVEFLEASLSGYEIAAQLGDKMRRDYEDQDDKLYQSGMGSLYLADALKCTRKLWNYTEKMQYPDRAFKLMENCKFQLLIDMFRKSRIHATADVGKVSVDRLDALRRRCVELDYVLAIPSLPKDSQAIYQSELVDLRLQHRRLQDSLEKSSKIYRTMYGQQSVVGIDSLQKLLPRDLAAFSFAMNDSVLFILSATNSSILFRQAELPTGFNDSIVDWIQLCRRPVETPGEIQTFARLGYLLYSKLLKPEIDQLTGIDRLLIIPDGILGNLPFEALLTESPRPETKGFVRLPYLMRRFRCHYAASATLWIDQQAIPFGGRELECLGMAWGGNGVDSLPGIRGKIAGLKGTEEELGAIREHVKGTFVMGAEATEAQFKSMASKYGILHLALHAMASETDPKILFPSAGNANEDGILHFHELFPLHLNARLAVLSACETGTGRVIKGEGIQSISSGFAAAGVPSLLMSLWEVDDRAGGQIIQSFYKGLDRGMAIDEALHKAKLYYLDQAIGYQAAPFYWAAFVPLGNMEPVQLKAPIRNYWWALWTGAFVVLCIFFSYRIYSINRKSI